LSLALRLGLMGTVLTRLMTLLTLLAGVLGAGLALAGIRVLVALAAGALRIAVAAIAPVIVAGALAIARTVIGGRKGRGAGGIGREGRFIDVLGETVELGVALALAGTVLIGPAGPAAHHSHIF